MLFRRFLILTVFLSLCLETHAFFDPNNSLLKKAESYRAKSLDSVFKYANLAMKSGKLEQDDKLLANTLLAEYYLSFYDFKNSRRYYDLAMLEVHKPEQKIEMLNNYYSWYAKSGDSDSAYYVLIKALEIAGRSNNLILKGVLLNNLGNFFLAHKQPQNAINYLLSSLKIWQEADPTKTAGVLSDIGNYYFNNGEFTKSIRYYSQALKVSQKNNDAFSIGFSANNLALAYQKKGDFTHAEQYFSISHKNYLSSGNVEGILISCFHLSLLYQQTGKFNKAESFLSIAACHLAHVKDKKLWYEYYFTEASLAEKTANYRLAAQFYKLSSLYQDSIIRLNPSLQLSEIKTRTDLIEQKKENKQLRAEQSRQTELILKQNIITGLIALLLLISVASVYYVARTSRIRKRIIVQLRRQNEVIEKQNLELAQLNVEMRIQKKQLTENLEFRNKLFSIVSHDVRSPLNSLQSLLELIAAGEELPRDVLSTMLKEVAERVSVTSSFMDNLLSWAKSQLEGYVPAVRALLLREEINNVLGLVEIQAKEKHIQIENNIENQTMAEADPEILKVVLRNLVSNAVKFTDRNGNIIISEHFENGTYVISIKDNGIGMTQERLQRVLDGTGFTSLGTFNEKGTGLGIALCKDLILKMKGRLWVESASGEGSTFSFSLPAHSKKIMVA
jgi:signal transduction histidine kinase/Tfp pilus assembly protein PilF